MSDDVSALVRVVEAQAHLRRARENLDGERPELAQLLTRSLAEVSDARQALAEGESATRGRSTLDDGEEVSSD